MNVLVTGRCLCGAVYYEIDRFPQTSLICQCTQCQKLTGTAIAPQIAIRKMRGEEVNICAHILCIAWNTTFPNKVRRISAEEFKEKTRGELVLVAFSNHAIVGFISLNESGCFIHQLFVSPEFQRKGIGKTLLNNVVQRMKGCQLSLKCNIENEAAIAFYHRFGFIRTEEYGEDETGPWITMQQAEI